MRQGGSEGQGGDEVIRTDNASATGLIGDENRANF